MTHSQRSHPIPVSAHPGRDGAPRRAGPECAFQGPGTPGAQGGARRSSPAQPSRPRADGSPGCGQTTGAAPSSPKDQEEKKPLKNAAG